MKFGKEIKIKTWKKTFIFLEVTGAQTNTNGVIQRRKKEKYKLLPIIKVKTDITYIQPKKLSFQDGKKVR